MGSNCSVRYLSVGMLLIWICQARAADSLRLERENGRNYVIHQVEKGETMYSLSRRYQIEINQMASQNGIVNNQLALGQVLKIPVDRAVPVEPVRRERSHTVKTGETLYSLSRQYEVTVQELRDWNDLQTTGISIGQVLKIYSPTGKEEKTVKETVSREPVEKITPKDTETSPGSAPPGFTAYLVQNGDLLETIAKKFSVRPDSIVIWNSLPNTYLTIGQKLLVKGELDAEYRTRPLEERSTGYGTIRKATDQSGFVKVYEEGIAGRIDSSVETDKYLAMHRTLSIGTLIEVRNLMNNQKVFVRVVGKLPETGLNENTLIRLTPVCFERLGVIDPKARVEVSYYEE